MGPLGRSDLHCAREGSGRGGNWSFIHLILGIQSLSSGPSRVKDTLTRIIWRSRALFVALFKLLLGWKEGAMDYCQCSRNLGGVNGSLTPYSA